MVCDTTAFTHTAITVSLNNDDDNNNGVIDYLDSTSSVSDNELVGLTFTSGSNATVYAVFWPSVLHAYTSTSKAVLLPSDVCWSSCASSCRPMTGWNRVVYFEGIQPGSWWVGPRFWECPPQPAYDSRSCQETIPIDVRGVDRVYWEVLTGNEALSPCPNNGGVRIFPDKQFHDEDADTGAYRRKVKLVAEVKPPKSGITVRFKVFDVDDPFNELNPSMANVNVIDDDDDGGDNRGTEALTLPWYKTATTNSAGKASVTFTVSMQPGNNYRAGATILADAIVQAGQTDADDVSAADLQWPGDVYGNYVPLTWSPMLTVWRKLHVETDTMVRPTFPQNTYSMNWGYPLPGGAPDRVQVSVEDTFAFATADGQFDEGWLTLTGSAGTVTGHIFEYSSSAGWDEMIVTISAADGIGGQKGLAGLAGMTTGTAIVSDDDLREELTFKNGIWGCNDGFAVNGCWLRLI